MANSTEAAASPRLVDQSKVLDHPSSLVSPLASLLFFQPSSMTTSNDLNNNGLLISTVELPSSSDSTDESASIKLHIRRVCSPPSSIGTAPSCRTSSIDDHTNVSASKQISIHDENTWKEHATQLNGVKRRPPIDEHDDAKRQKLTTTIDSPCTFRRRPLIFHLSLDLSARSSTRLKKKRQPIAELNPADIHERRLSTELVAASPSDYQQYSSRSCQTTDDLVAVSHQSVQTSVLCKSDKSTYTDFVDQPLCENSTQTQFKDDQDTQTTDLNCPHHSHVSLHASTSSETQCDGLHSILAERNTHSLPSKSERIDDRQRLSTPYIDLALTNENHARLQLFQDLIHVEEHPNGGASLIRTNYHDFVRLTDENASLFVNYFFQLVYGEMNQRAKYSIGVLHDGARYLPDLIEYFSQSHPKMIVKTSNILNSKEVLTTTMSEYRNRVIQTYSHGTFRYGPMMSVSLIGTVPGKEECGKSS